MIDFDIDLNEGLRSFNTKFSPMYKIYINGREYEMREVEALFLSRKVQRVIENDETVNMIDIKIRKEDIFSEYDIGEAEFDNILFKSFEQILNTVHNIFTNNCVSNSNYGDVNGEMSLEELCCIKAILEVIESKSLKVKECKYNEEIERLGNEKTIEILNVIGSEKSIEYVGKHLMDIKAENLIRKISPGRLEEVLMSEGVQVREEGDILRVVEESIGVYGWGAGFLLGSVEASFLSRADRNLYVELISQYISLINENNSFKDVKQYRRYNRESDNRNRIDRKWKEEVKIEGTIVESLLRCIGKNGREHLKESDPLVQCDLPIKQFIAKNLNEYFKGRITTSAKSIDGNNDKFKPVNVLIPGEGQHYQSEEDINSRGQWIQFDFPEEICVKKFDIRPFGNKFNPQKLNIKALNGKKENLIAVAEFQEEPRKTYNIYTMKDDWTKTIRIEMDGENYWGNFKRYKLDLYEVTITGYTFE